MPQPTNKPEQVEIKWIKVSPRDKLNPRSLYRRFSNTLKPKHFEEDFRRIRVRIRKTGMKGAQKLWSGYEETDGERRPAMVSSHRLTGEFFSTLVVKTRPNYIIEFGTAFGVSGMYWLTGLKHNHKGHLYTYEVNKDWAAIAVENLAAISDRFTMTADLFEKSVDKTLGKKKISIAFIDGIHTSEWVIPQFDIVYSHMKRGGIVLFDDITFSTDMTSCWEKIVAQERVKSAAIVNSRVGLVIVQ